MKIESLYSMREQVEQVQRAERMLWWRAAGLVGAVGLAWLVAVLVLG